jgi:hypothetical protein
MEFDRKPKYDNIYLMIANCSIEVVRYEFVQLLVALIDAFPSHCKLQSLHQLYHPSDPDVDFFTNIVHLQLHRRQRALRRLVDSLHNSEVCTYSSIQIVSCSTLDTNIG